MYLCIYQDYFVFCTKKNLATLFLTRIGSILYVSEGVVQNVINFLCVNRPLDSNLSVLYKITIICSQAFRIKWNFTNDAR
jgi:hypothetical protein